MSLIWFILSAILFFSAFIELLYGDIVGVITLFIGGIYAFKKSGVGIWRVIVALIFLDLLSH